MERDVLYWLLAIFLGAIGLAGVVLPAIPGAPLLFAGLFLAAWVENFAYVGKWTLTILGLLALLTYGVDFWAAMFGAKRFGASRSDIGGRTWPAAMRRFLKESTSSHNMRAA